MANLDHFAKGIASTGFILENRIVQMLTDAGWTVISNRYYEDDREGTVREMDVLAYRISKARGFDVCTCIIVSCKKSETDAWCFLARDLKRADPNVDYWPVHAWSNVKSITYELTAPGRSKAYHEFVDKLGIEQVLRTPAVELFAFQEMDKKTGAAHNQKNIFASLTTLLKSQAYEMGSLAKRKSTPFVYQFNLVSVVDSDIVRLKIDGDVVTPSAVSDEHLISSYIIKGSQSFSRVRFLTEAGFKAALPEYTDLHNANVVWYEQLDEDFFSDIVTDQKRIKVLEEGFFRELRWRIDHRLYVVQKVNADLKSVWFAWNPENEVLTVNLSGDNYDFEVSKFLETDQETRDNVASALKKVYRYTGQFRISADDIPF